MAPNSSTLAWKIPWTEEPERLQSMGLLRVGHDWATSLSLFTFMHWRRKWQPTPVCLPRESQGRWSLVGCRLWGRTELDMTEVTWQQQGLRRKDRQIWARTENKIQVVSEQMWWSGLLSVVTKCSSSSSVQGSKGNLWSPLWPRWNASFLVIMLLKFCHARSLLPKGNFSLLGPH